MGDRRRVARRNSRSFACKFIAASRRRRVLTLARLDPLSRFEIVCLRTPTRSASSVCDQPLASRMSFKTSPAEQSNNRVRSVLVTLTPLP